MQKYATLYALSIFLCIWLSFLYSASCPKLRRNEDRRHCSTSSDLLSSLLATLSDSAAESSWVVVSTCTLALSSCGKSTLLPSTERTVVALRHCKPLLSRQAVHHHSEGCLPSNRVSSGPSLSKAVWILFTAHWRSTKKALNTWGLRNSIPSFQ